MGSTAATSTSDTSDEPRSQEASGSPAEEHAERRAFRAGLAVAGAALAACLALGLFGILGSDGGGAGTTEHRTRTAPVTYEVTGTGTADITYQSGSEAGTATVVSAATLPWRTTVQVPVGRDPIVSIVLGGQGGQARCALAIRGDHVQSATASGEFGRATCTGRLPEPS
ncbi:hypothetical protein [Streptomyces sp. NPDC004629]|uniref:hypothetical protein n=1 Tax=Streptomyces sp. NPDC004629 TaxID=3364705 RepID=UPI00367A20C5